ncbi:MAG TPA: FtsX-like permease family protein, partial [Ohtaekwangia sp.]|nr:FtsX-like permease family protein [Ohtaekwangia sp.]
KKHALPQLLLGQIFTLQPVKDIHLKSELQAEPSPPNTFTNIYIFVGVGILTLIIACINYINLSTAQSFTRIKEIGIRKILGSMKYQLIVQFLAESFLFCLVSMTLAYAVFYTLLPLLNSLTDKHLVFNQVVDYNLLTGSLVLLLAITFLAGGYPAYFITQFESINALKGGSAMDLGNQWLRKVLVVFQLAIACALMSGSLLIVKQMNYLAGRPLGFQKEHVVNIPLYSVNLNGIFRQNDSTFRVRLQTFRDEVEKQTGVISTALSATAPGLGGTYRGTLPEGYTQEEILIIANMPVDYDFLKTYGVEVVAGRSFSRDHATDVAEGFMINEAAVKEFNWGSPEEAIGKTMNREGKIGKVIGVFRDFHYESLERPIGALILEMNTEQFNTLSIRFENADVQQVIEKLEASWNRMFPEKSFQFTFLEEQLNEQYAAFQNFGTIIQAFTVIAILISCLGVYGLVLFVVQRKVKEIGVRKVLGATLPNILTLIYKDFAWLLGLGFLFGIPISYYLMQQWLTNFTYHTSPDVLTYLLSLLLVVTIVLLTISYQAIRASLANPVSSLRSE